MSDKFSLAGFIHLVEKADSIPDGSVKFNSQLIKLFELIRGENVATDEFLSKMTIEQLEWVFDAVLYWPSTEADLEREDVSHVLYQHFEFKDIIHSLSILRPKREKVSFL